MKDLKSILKVKKGTTNDLEYHELRRGTIISAVHDRQFSFFQKLAEFTEADAMVASIIIGLIARVEAENSLS